MQTSTLVLVDLLNNLVLYVWSSSTIVLAMLVPFLNVNDANKHIFWRWRPRLRLLQLY
jgi:hypothetical protein